MTTIQAVDSAFKTGVSNDYSVMSTWATDGAVLLPRRRLAQAGRVPRPRRRDQGAGRAAHAEHDPRRGHCERAVAIQQLRRDTALPIVAVAGGGHDEGQQGGGDQPAVRGRARAACPSSRRPGSDRGSRSTSRSRPASTTTRSTRPRWRSPGCGRTAAAARPMSRASRSSRVRREHRPFGGSGRCSRARRCAPQRPARTRTSLQNATFPGPGRHGVGTSAPEKRNEVELRRRRT